MSGAGYRTKPVGQEASPGSLAAMRAAAVIFTRAFGSRRISVMENVAVSLDEKIARWVQTRAAERGTSVAECIGEVLGEQMREDEVYEAAMERYLSRKPTRISEKGEYPRREELYDRAGLRR
jgi:hypothetical protein